MTRAVSSDSLVKVYSLLRESKGALFSKKDISKQVNLNHYSVIICLKTLRLLGLVEMMSNENSNVSLYKAKVMPDD